MRGLFLDISKAYHKARYKGLLFRLKLSSVQGELIKKLFWKAWTKSSFK